ncbi:CMRF35-like molecule 1 isoform X1 [Seriola lalandi dorsalis]|uniref:CMRF35-like molecule 3 n=1 Tax=Seriola lalandi dorsalis TaxID=1841481 RepID=A0A3B4YSJ4_SERLL|nr:CMRF35-like molecule 1 isoform X1 [Seriola lalandi dorsalis]XP_056240684.1 CMRF35-like molecule 1 isoform X1 [Seriola aureovittata]
MFGCFFSLHFAVTVLCLIWLTKHTVDSVQLSAPEKITAPYGGSVTVSCQYEHQFRENTKYWCKGPVYDLCTIVVKTPKNRPGNRSSIADDKEAGVFTVTMTSLRDSDEGSYWCVVATSGRNIYSRVRLSVSHTVVTTTVTTPTSSSLEHDEMRWWATLRWILFILMLCCLASIHIAVWRIKGTRKICVQQFQYQNSNIYD